jgi:hypothetical protein
VIRAKMFLAGSFEFWSSELSASQLSEVTWSSWLLSCQVEVSLWREGVYEMATNLGSSWVVSWQEVCTGSCDNMTWVQEAEESPSVEAVARKWLVETVIEDSSLCVCQWSVKCSSEWCVQVVNKSVHQSKPCL